MRNPEYIPEPTGASNLYLYACHLVCMEESTTVGDHFFSFATLQGLRCGRRLKVVWRALWTILETPDGPSSNEIDRSALYLRSCDSWESVFSSRPDWSGTDEGLPCSGVSDTVVGISGIWGRGDSWRDCLVSHPDERRVRCMASIRCIASMCLGLAPKEVFEVFVFFYSLLFSTALQYYYIRVSTILRFYLIFI